MINPTPTRRSRNWDEPPEPAASERLYNGPPIFPCVLIEREDGTKIKKPLTPHGFKDATRDRSIIEKWWLKWPNALIGMPTGKVTLCFVLDIDPRHGGDVLLAEIEAKYGKLPPTRTHRTLQGGLHLIFRYPKGVKIPSGNPLGPGIDVQSDGRYVIIPPSSGYTVIDDREPAEAPEWLIELLTKPKLHRPVQKTQTKSPKARYRPKQIVVVPFFEREPKDYPKGTVKIRMPGGLLQNEAAVFAACIEVANEFLHKGYSLNMIVNSCALGTDHVHSKLGDYRTVFGEPLHRVSVNGIIRRFCKRGILTRTGRLKEWIDNNTERGPMEKEGAYTYSTGIPLVQVGDLIQRSRNRLISNPQDPSPPTTTMPLGSCVSDLGVLLSALERVEVGMRNNLGFWLACRLRRDGVSFDHALEVLTDYQEMVPQDDHPYTLDEAERSLRSAYAERVTSCTTSHKE